MSRTKTNFKDGNSFVFGSDGAVSYHDQAATALWESDWGAQWTNRVAYTSEGQNYVLSYNTATGDYVAHHCTNTSGTKKHEAKTDAGFTALKVAYCGDDGYLMFVGGEKVNLVKLTATPTVISTGKGDPMALLQAHLNDPGASSSGGSGASSSAPGSARRGMAVGLPGGYIFSFTGGNKMTYKTEAKVFWEAQWDEAWITHQVYIFESGNYVLSYKPTDDTVQMSHLTEAGSKVAFVSKWESGWQTFLSKIAQGTHYLVASKPGKSEIQAIAEDGIKLVFSTSGDDPEQVFVAFEKTLVIGEKVITLQFDDKDYFTYTSSSKVTYCSPDARLWEADWSAQGWSSYMGFTDQGKNYLITTASDQDVSIHHLSNTGSSVVFSGKWEHKFTSFCMSSFGENKYLICGKADGHCILHLFGQGYKIVWTSKLMQANEAFEEYVRTLLGEGANISFSKSASASTALETLKYPNGYSFAYYPDNADAEVSYDSPAQQRCWKTKWEQDYSHHVGYVFFGKNYLISYQKGSGVSDIRLLSGEDGSKTGTAKLDGDWTNLRVAYFDDQAYLITEAPGKQAIYQLSGNSQKLIHLAEGDTTIPAEAVIKKVAANNHNLRLPNGFKLEFDDKDKLSVTGPQGHLFDAPADSKALNVALVQNGEPLLLSVKPGTKDFDLSALTPTGLKPKAKGALDKPYNNFTPLYHNANAFFVADAPDGTSSLLQFTNDPSKPVIVTDLGATTTPEAAFRKHLAGKEPYAFVVELNQLPSKDKTPVTHICFPQETVLKVTPDHSLSYVKGNEKPLFSSSWDQDTTHGLGFVNPDDKKNYAVTYKHGQGKVEIQALEAGGPKSVATGDIDPTWLTLDVVHTPTDAFLVAAKPGAPRGLYRLTPKGVKKVDGAAVPEGSGDKLNDYLATLVDSESPAAQANAAKAAADKKAADEKASAAKAAADKKAVDDKAAADKKAADDKAASDKAAADKTASDKAAADKAASDKAAADKKSADDKAAADKAASDKAASDKAASDKAASDKAASDKAASDKKAADDKAAADKAAAAKPTSASPAGTKPGSHLTGAVNSGFSSETCEKKADHVVFSDHTFAAVFCHGKLSYNTCHWTVELPHTTHVLGFTEKGTHFVYSYNSEDGQFTITKLTQSGPVETHKGKAQPGWTSFRLQEFEGNFLLYSSNTEKTDIGVLASTGYTLLESQSNVSDKIRAHFQK